MAFARLWNMAFLMPIHPTCLSRMVFEPQIFFSCLNYCRYFTWIFYSYNFYDIQYYKDWFCWSFKLEKEKESPQVTGFVKNHQYNMVKYLSNIPMLGLCYEQYIVTFNFK